MVCNPGIIAEGAARAKRHMIPEAPACSHQDSQARAMNLFVRNQGADPDSQEWHRT